MLITPVTINIETNVRIDVIDARTLELLDRLEVHNLVVTAGRNLVRDRIYASATAAISHFWVGMSSQAVAATDTDLIDAVGAPGRQAITSNTVADGQLTTKYFLPSGTANSNTLREAGIFNAASGGSMFVRATHAAIVKTSSIQIIYSWLTSVTAS